MQFLDIVNDIPLQLQVFFISLVPLLELRAAIPYGIARGLDPVTSVAWGTFGNLVQVPIVAAIVWAAHRYVTRYIPAAAPFLDWTNRRALRSERLIRKYGLLGLALFVAFPFPGSGIWSAAALGSLLHLNFWGTVVANCLGVVVAGVVVGLAATGALQVFHFLW